MNRLEKLKALKSKSSSEQVVKVIKGDTGAPGKDGSPGIDGSNGYTPIKGIDYFDGKDGKDGLPGKDGKNGKDGRPGRDGINGKDGKSIKGDKGINWKDDWLILTNYVVDDAVYHEGSSYICVKAHQATWDTSPGIGSSWAEYWSILALKGASITGGSSGGGTSSQWTDVSGGILYNNGHVAVGANADVNGTGQINSYLQSVIGTGTYSTVLGIQETMTGTPASWNVGQIIKTSANFNADVGLLYSGMENTTEVSSSNAHNVNIGTGLYNTFIHRGTGTITTAYGAPNIVVSDNASGTISDARAVYGGVVNKRLGGTITTAYNFYSDTPVATGTIGTMYGMFLAPVSQGSTANYGISIGGASTNTLWIGHDGDFTTAPYGITFGLSKDTNLYRSAANTLKTDDNLVVGSPGTSSGSVVTTDGTQTLTNKRVTPRVTTITSSATPTINTDNCDYVNITALATAITSMTTNLSGTPNHFDKLTIRFKDDGTARAITWGASFEACGVALPTTTVISKRLTVGFLYSTTTSKWGCVASVQES